MKTNTTQQNIPKGWKYGELGSFLADIGDGGTPLRSNSEYFGGNIPWVVVNDIQPRIKQTRNTLTDVGLQKSSAKLWPAGSVILSFGATIGEVGIADVPVTTKQGIAGIIPNDDLLNIYLYYVLLSKKKLLHRLSSGSTIKEVRPSVIKNQIEVLIPPIKEQQKIAEILGAVDEDIAKTQEVIEETEKLKRGLMQQLFTRGIGHKKFKETKIGQIPESWDIEKIGGHTTHVGSGATPRGGSKVYLTEGISFIRSQNVYFEGLIQKDLVYIDKETHEEMSRSKTLPNDVLLNITGASIGRACIVPADLLDANVNQHVCIIRPSKDLLYKYLFYFLQSESGQDQIFKFQIGGNREGLNFQQIRSIEFPFPKNIKEQEQITEILSAVDEKVLVNKRLKEKLTLLKKGLMQDLLSGKVRV